jgi:hypothetical protein
MCYYDCREFGPHFSEHKYIGTVEIEEDRLPFTEEESMCRWSEAMEIDANRQ